MANLVYEAWSIRGSLNACAGAETTRQIWLEEVDFPLLLTKEVFTNEDQSVGVRYLVSSDLTLSFDQQTKLYQKRWSIEVYHQSLKQNASLEK